MSGALPPMTGAARGALPSRVQSGARALASALARPRALFDSNAGTWLHTRRSRVCVVLGVMAGFTWLALQQSVGSAELRLEPEISPVPVAPARCRAHGEQALAQARLLEQLASASWERVPFEPRESPRAVEHIAEAEACYAQARDRTGRLRTAAAYYHYSADLERRFARARLLLRMAMRADEKRERARHTDGSPGPARALSRLVAELLALLERAPPSARAYRTELQRLARRVGGAGHETQTRRETPVNRDHTQPERTP